jgi:hypothetical protein
MSYDLDPDLKVTVDAGELDEWAWLLSHVEDWLLHAQPDTIADYQDFARSPRFDDVVATLGQFSVRMHRLARNDRGQP